jgi:hypothetical protein
MSIEASAAGVLKELTGDVESAAAVVSAGGIPPLVKLLRTGTATTRLCAAAALRNLSVDAEYKSAIAAAVPV